MSGAAVVFFVALGALYLVFGYMFASDIVEFRSGSDSDTKVAFKAMGMNIFWAPVMFFEWVASTKKSDWRPVRIILRFYGG
jgi:hypothetical protein